jgi:uroporphyrinogen decarboxylase
VMDDIIEVAKIDAKHSNEDDIAPFSEWVDRYGDRIGNFGGVDMNHLCFKSEPEIAEIVRDVMSYCKGKGGWQLYSGLRAAGRLHSHDQRGTSFPGRIEQETAKPSSV